MFESIICPNVKTVYDYLNYTSELNENTAFIAKAPVQVWDEIDLRFYTYQFLCGINGSELRGADGDFACSFRAAFQKINVDKISSDKLKIGGPDSELYLFQDKTDVENFIVFAQEYNAFIDRITEAAIKECRCLGKKIYHDEIANVTREFIEVLPQQLFTEVDLYKAFIRHMSWKDGLFSKYLGFSQQEIEDAYYLIHSPSNENAFNQIYGLFMQFSNAIAEQLSLPMELKDLTSYFVIREGLIDIYSSFWKENCNMDCKSPENKMYIEDCAEKNLVSSTDNASLTVLTYYLMSTDAIEKEFHEHFMFVRDTVLDFENSIF